jgi:glucose/mannose-6-phosphate isomerase
VSAADPLSADAIAAAGATGAVGDVLAQPAQLADAVWRAESASFPRGERPGGLVVAGEEGAAGGDLAAAVLAGRAEGPVRAFRGYQPGAGVDASTLVVCASYSGDGEEALACFEAAGDAGAARAAITTGGPLAEAARAAGAPVMGVPSGFDRRASIVYTTVGALEAAAACGAAPSVRGEIEAAGGPLGALAAEWGPESPPESDAKRLANALHGSFPVIHAAGPAAAAARRWRAGIAATLPACAAELPEALDSLPAYTPPVTAVFLDDPAGDPRLRSRIDGAVAGAGVPVERAEARGQTPFEQVMSLVLLGDLVAAYLAILAGGERLG